MPIMPCGTKGGYQGSPHLTVLGHLFWIESLVCCMVLSPASTDRRQVFLGLPLFCFPSGVQ